MAVETENFFEEDVLPHFLRDKNGDGGNFRASLHRIVDFIDSARVAQGRVLVHCNSGISRSSAAVLAYLVRRGPRSGFPDSGPRARLATTTVRTIRHGPPRGAGMARETAHRESPSRIYGQLVELEGRLAAPVPIAATTAVGADAAADAAERAPRRREEGRPEPRRPRNGGEWKGVVS